MSLFCVDLNVCGRVRHLPKGSPRPFCGLSKETGVDETQLYTASPLVQQFGISTTSWKYLKYLKRNCVCTGQVFFLISIS